jgi:hypothetical protein
MLVQVVSLSNHDFLRIILLISIQKPEIDSSSNNGACPGSLTGNLDFRNIHFHYPSRPDVPVSTLQHSNNSIDLFKFLHILMSLSLFYVFTGTNAAAEYCEAS